MLLEYVSVLPKSLGSTQARHTQAIRCRPLQCTAIEEIQLMKSRLHDDLCQLCVCQKLFKAALCLLDVDITTIVSSDEKHKAKIKYLLLCYYYGGNIDTEVKKYDGTL